MDKANSRLTNLIAMRTEGEISKDEYQAMRSFVDEESGSTISHDVVKQFVYLITPTSDTTFDWYVNLNGTADVKATFTAEGRKKMNVSY